MNFGKRFLPILLLLLVACNPTTGDPGANTPETDTGVPGGLATIPPTIAVDPTATATASPTLPPTHVPANTPTATAPSRPEEVPDLSLEGLPPEVPVIVFYQSGGIMGLNDEWRFFPTDLLSDQNGEKWQLPPGTVEGLLTTAVTNNFFNMEESYLPENTCCDFFFYTVEIDYRGVRNGVTTMDGATNAPDGLFSLIQEIQALLRTVREGGSFDPVQ